jgi:hypothetical protein
MACISVIRVVAIHGSRTRSLPVRRPCGAAVSNSLAVPYAYTLVAIKLQWTAVAAIKIKEAILSFPPSLFSSSNTAKSHLFAPEPLQPLRHLHLVRRAAAAAAAAVGGEGGHGVLEPGEEAGQRRPVAQVRLIILNDLVLYASYTDYIDYTYIYCTNERCMPPILIILVIDIARTCALCLLYRQY